MMEPALRDAFLLEALNRRVAWVCEVPGAENAILSEVVDIHFRDCHVGGPHEPACQVGRGILPYPCQERLWMPADPDVPLPNLHYRAAQCADPGDWMEW